MSWSITLNGHQNEQDHERLVELATRLRDEAKNADVGLSYINLTDAQGHNSIPLETEPTDDDSG